MDRRAIGIVGVVGAALLGVSLIAQQPQPQTSGQQPEKQGRQMMSMDDMMKGCREHCQATTKSIDHMMKMMDEAKASNDAIRCARPSTRRRSPSLR
jgi:hypothetical protein